jgi:hypothetical protein
MRAGMRGANGALRRLFDRGEVACGYPVSVVRISITLYSDHSESVK